MNKNLSENEIKIFCKTDINYKKQYHLFDRLDQKGILINSKIFFDNPTSEKLLYKI